MLGVRAIRVHEQSHCPKLELNQKSLCVLLLILLYIARTVALYRSDVVCVQKQGCTQRYNPFMRIKFASALLNLYLHTVCLTKLHPTCCVTNSF